MLTLLLGIAYWTVVLWAAYGAVVLITCLWFWLKDLLADDQDGYHVVQWGVKPLRPYDWNDPLEQAWSLPEAPNPRFIR